MDVRTTVQSLVQFIEAEEPKSIHMIVQRNRSVIQQHITHLSQVFLLALYAEEAVNAPVVKQ